MLQSSMVKRQHRVEATYLHFYYYSKNMGTETLFLTTLTATAGRFLALRHFNFRAINDSVLKLYGFFAQKNPL